MQNMYGKPAGVAGASAFDLENGQGELDLLATARTLWRGKWIIMLAIIAAVALSLAYVMFLATPLYTAQSVVALQNRQENVVDLESVMSGVGGDQASIMKIDTPPVLVVPDARVIAQLADVVVYVVHWDRTPRTQVLQGIHSFATVNVPVNGLVLSQIDPRGMKRYGYTGTYGYGYGASKAYYDA